MDTGLHFLHAAICLLVLVKQFFLLRRKRFCAAAELLDAAAGCLDRTAGRGYGCLALSKAGIILIQLLFGQIDLFGLLVVLC